MGDRLSQPALDQLFCKARTHQGWTSQAIPECLLKELYELMKWAPTCVNGAPARIVFLQSKKEKEKLLPALMGKNVEKTREAAVTAIIAYDLKWYEHLPKLFPHVDYRSLYADNKELNEATAFRNSSLQGGYFILAARSLGLDVGPMSGFDINQVNKTFFDGTHWRVNFLCNLGFGDPEKIFPRGPRLSFEEACRIV